MNLNLPPFPDDLLPATQEDRLKWIWWGRECVKMGMERSAEICNAEKDKYHKTRKGLESDRCDAITIFASMALGAFHCSTAITKAKEEL